MDEQLKKYFSGELSAEEKRVLFNRIQSDPDLKRDFVRLQNAEALSSLAEQEGDKEWASAKLDEWQERLRKKNARRRNGESGGMCHSCFGKYRRQAGISF